MVRVVQGKLIVERITSIEEQLEKPAKVTISADEMKEDKKKLAQKAEQ